MHLAGRERKPARQLGMARRREQHYEAGNDEREWRVHIGLPGYFADQYIEACTNRDAEPVENNERQGQGSPKLRFGHRSMDVAGTFAHAHSGCTLEPARQSGGDNNRLPHKPVT